MSCTSTCLTFYAVPGAVTRSVATRNREGGTAYTSSNFCRSLVTDPVIGAASGGNGQVQAGSGYAVVRRTGAPRARSPAAPPARAPVAVRGRVPSGSNDGPKGITAAMASRCPICRYRGAGRGSTGASADPGRASCRAYGGLGRRCATP